MPYANQITGLLKNLISQGGLILFFAFLLTRLGILRRQVLLSGGTAKKILLLTIYFSGIGIMGTYTGIPVMGALANARVVGVFVGGLLGGPVVGIACGFIAGFHRWAIDVGGFTAFACMVSTLLEGTMAGFLSVRFGKVENKWLFAALWAAVAELLQMVIILLIAKPFEEAIRLVELIAVPMIFGNAIGIGMFIAIAEDALREAERIAVRQSHRVLNIVRETMEHLRSGLTPETAEAVASIILKHIKVSAVSLSDKELCLAFKGKGEDHHKALTPLKTRLTQEVLAKGAFRVAKSHREIGCDHEDCPLSSAVIVPLKKEGETVGTLKLYRAGEWIIGPVDIEVAQGLAMLFSTQIEVSELQKQKEMLATAELHALQSQIRPHFLFNALNTITSLIRTSPDRARELMVTLADLLRQSLKKPDTLITVEEEMSYIRSYLEIEQARFGDQLAVEYRITAPPETRLPPLILQPIVENAVKHGMGDNLSRSRIIITAEPRGKEIGFSVSDTGPGMDPDMIERLGNNRDTGRCVGLRNINERLEHLYGRSLNIESPMGQGTTVSFTIPGAPS